MSKTKLNELAKQIIEDNKEISLNYVGEQLDEFNKKLDEINKAIDNDEASKNLFNEISQ